MEINQGTKRPITRRDLIVAAAAVIFVIIAVIGIMLWKSSHPIPVYAPSTQNLAEGALFVIIS
ncbi:MAG TPA: hypothetical protein VHD31_03315 [Candidatus Paceibacterota bacterium]|nr:hypothetical protein [Candidatus Paceibacterota bacterium]